MDEEDRKRKERANEDKRDGERARERESNEIYFIILLNIYMYVYI